MKGSKKNLNDRRNVTMADVLDRGHSGSAVEDPSADEALVDRANRWRLQDSCGRP